MKDYIKPEWKDSDDPKFLRDELRHIYTLLWDTAKANDVIVREGENPIISIGRYLCNLKENS